MDGTCPTMRDTQTLAIELGFAGTDQHILTVAGLQPGVAEAAPTITKPRI